MGRLGWAIILGSLFGAILFGIIQRGCSAEADGSRIVVVPSEPSDFEKDLQQSIAASPAASPQLAPPPSTAPRSRGVSPINRNANRTTAPIQRTNPGESPEEAEARRNQMREDRKIALENMRRNLQNGNGTARRTIPSGVTPAAAAGQPVAEVPFEDGSRPEFVPENFIPNQNRRVVMPNSSASSQSSSSESASDPSSGSGDSSSGSDNGSDSLGGSGGGGFVTSGSTVITAPPDDDDDDDGDDDDDDDNGATPTVPAAFTLLTPAHNSAGVSLTPTFTWQAASGAASYRFQLAEDPAFASILFEAPTLTTTTLALPTGILEPGVTAYWRVTARNTTGQTNSGSTFSFVSARGPGAFTLTTPANNGPAITLPATLTWQASENASSYLLTIARDSAFTDVAITESIISGTTFMVPTGALEEGATYFWKVVALNAIGATAAAPASASFRILGQPGEFMLVSPSPAAADLFIPVPLAWTPAIDASSYRIEVATDAEFTNRVVNIGDLTTTSFLLTSSHIQPGTTYHWRVTASNAVDVRGSTPGSASFSTLPGPGEFALTSPGDGGSGTLPVTLQWQESAGTLLYTVELSSNASFTNILATQLVIPLIDGTSWTVPDNLLQVNKTYFWRVTAENIVGRRSAVVSPFSFTIREADYDVNGDGSVNVRDLYAFHALPNPKPDLNLDGIADDNDRLGLRGAVRREEPEDVAGN